MTCPTAWMGQARRGALVHPCLRGTLRVPTAHTCPFCLPEKRSAGKKRQPRRHTRCRRGWVKRRWCRAGSRDRGRDGLFGGCPTAEARGWPVCGGAEQGRLRRCSWAVPRSRSGPAARLFSCLGERAFSFLHAPDALFSRAGEYFSPQCSFRPAQCAGLLFQYRRGCPAPITGRYGGASVSGPPGSTLRWSGRGPAARSSVR